MTPEDTAAWALARINTAFFHHYDRREYDAVLDLFAPDAHYEVHGRRLRGHAEILDVLNARPGPEQTVRHLMAGQHFHTITDTTARGTVTVFAYAGPTSTDGGPARYLASNAGHIVELTDDYQAENGRWKIAKRSVDMILAPVTS
ncbi:nuclear transport factor 2 family protein [Streptomyces sp. NBC_01578]|uniref:nuclear transport factor 2 family protein n=1 Tax=Streptomyces sp. NBC_01578 TaxID=2975884 RepID=UPI00386E60A9